MKWDGLPAIVVAVAEEDTECPYRVFSEGHEVSGWVSGEVLTLVEVAKYEARAVGEVRVGDLVSTPDGKGVLAAIDVEDPGLPFNVGVFRVGTGWYTATDTKFISRPDYGEVV